MATIGEVKRPRDGAQRGRSLAPGEFLLTGGDGWSVRQPTRTKPATPSSRSTPSADALFAPVAKVCDANALGVILTGMGSDGSNGLLDMSRAGARTFGQSEAYGMPKVAFEVGAAEKQLPLHRIGSETLAATAVQM